MVPPALLVKKCDQVLFHVLLGQNETAKKKKSDIKDRKRCAERFPSNVLRHIRFPYVASLKSYVRVVYIQAGAHHYGLLIQEDSQRPAPSWLVNSIGRALRLYRSTLGTRGFSRVRQEFSVLAEGRHIFAYLARKVSGTQGRSRVRIPYKPDFFSGFLSHTAKKCVENAMIFFHIIQLTLL